MSDTLYYHSTEPRFVDSIMKGGFKIGELTWGRVLGRGLYLSATSEYARKYHGVIIICTLKRGTRILWHKPYNKRVISYLKREFGSSIIRPDFHKLIPKNKKLSKNELSNFSAVQTCDQFKQEQNEMSEERIDLSHLDEEYAETEVPEQEFSPIPDGKYQVLVELAKPQR